MHSFSHQASTDPQLPLDHEKHPLCTVADVAWRPTPRRQAVHQLWNFPDTCTTPTTLQISSTSRNFTFRTSLIWLYLFHRFSFQNFHTNELYITRYYNKKIFKR